jgi:hypothetical protein
MTSVKPRNTALADHLAEAGISRAGLAHRVVALAAARSLPAPRYNHASVARWLRGEHPRGHTPDLIAEVLSATIGRKITAVDIGMSKPSRADVGLNYLGPIDEAVCLATELYGTDVRRHDVLARGTYTASAYTTPALRWITAPATTLTDRAGTVRVGPANVSAIREVTATFRRLDNMFGGGYARSTVVQYLADEVGPLMRHGAYRAETGRALFTAVAEMTLLAGWMAYDLEQHPIAQRYLIQALRLARAGEDEALGGEILTAMACQSAYLGEAADAVDLARAAQRSARRAGSGALLSEALATEAHGHALAGDSRACATALNGAHVALDQSADEPAWLRYFDAAYLAAKTGRALIAAGDPTEATIQLRLSLDMQSGFERGHVFNLAMLAAALVDRGDIEEATAVAGQAAGAGRGIASARMSGELQQLVTRLAPHQQLPAVVTVLRALSTGHSGTRALPSGR